MIAHQRARDEIHKEASNLPSTTTPGPPFEYRFNAGTKAYLLVPFSGVFLVPIFQVAELIRALAEIIGCLDLLLLTRNNKRTFQTKTNYVEIGI